MTIEITGDGGVYMVTWDDSAIEFTFERFREDRGSLRAEVWVRDHNLRNPHVAFDTVNLGSKRTKNGFAKDLGEVHPGYNWTNLVEAACTKVLLQERKGEPIVSIRDIILDDSPTYRIQPFIFMGYPTLLFGSGGIGKSLFAAYLSVLTTEGYITDDIEMEPCRVLYLDWESTADDLTERCDMVANGLGTGQRPEIFYRYCSRPLQDDFDYIKREIIERKIGMVVIDSAGPACGKPSDENLVIPFFTALRALKTSSLILGHKPKGGDNPFGSIYWVNYSRSVWEMKADSDPAMGFSDIGLFNTKVNRGPMNMPRAYRTVFQNDGYSKMVRYEQSSIGESEELSDKLPLKERIRDVLLKSGSKHYKTIAEELGESEKTVLVSLGRNPNRFQKLGGGVYGVSSVFPEVDQLSW